jgi:hypothetical protein
VPLGLAALCCEAISIASNKDGVMTTYIGKVAVNVAAMGVLLNLLSVVLSVIQARGVMLGPISTRLFSAVAVGGFLFTATSLLCVVATLYSWIAVITPFIGLVMVVCILLVAVAFELETVPASAIQRT